MERRKIQSGRTLMPVRSRRATHVSSSTGISNFLHTQGRKWISRSVIFCIGVLCLIIVIGILLQAVSNHNLSRQLQATTTQTQSMQRINKQLQQDIIQYAQPAIIEAEARRELQYIHPGDHVIIMSPSTSPASQQTSATIVKTPAVWWHSLWNFILHPGGK